MSSAILQSLSFLSLNVLLSISFSCLFSRRFHVSRVGVVSSTLIYLGGLADSMADLSSTGDFCNMPSYLLEQYIERYGARLDGHRIAACHLLFDDK